MTNTEEDKIFINEVKQLEEFFKVSVIAIVTYVSIALMKFISHGSYLDLLELLDLIRPLK